MIEANEVVTIISDAVWVVIISAAPVLVVGIAIGLIVSIFQATTSINEQTLAFVPKIVAILLALVIFGSFMINNISDYITNLYQSISTIMQ